MKHFSLDIFEGIAYLVFNQQKEAKANKFNRETLGELDALLLVLEKKASDIKALVFSSAKENIFIAGADIKELESINSLVSAQNKAKAGQDIFLKWRELPFPTIAVVEGACMGGGTEFILSFNYRIAIDSPKVKIALPEVNLGIIPGFGGTQSLVRVVNLVDALKLITTGATLGSKDAYRKFLLDALFPVEYKKQFINLFVDKILSDEGRNSIEKRRKQRFKRLCEAIPFFRTFVYRKFKKIIKKKTQGHYPAPLKAVDLIEKTYKKMSFEEGLVEELEVFSSLAISRECKNLIHLFFVNEDLKKSYLGKNNFEFNNISSSVIGSGVMGSEIAFLFLKRDCLVHLHDIEWNFLERAIKHILKIFKTLRRLKKFTQRDFNKVNYLSLTTSSKILKNKDFILEAIIEDKKIKQKLFAECESLCSKNTIIATNTSSLRLEELKENMKYPERFIGMHFFNPATRMPLVEVITHSQTDKKSLEKVIALSRFLGKIPIVVSDCAGFLVNRILLPYLNEAAYLLEECGDIILIDDVAKKFGFPVGPFELCDTIGIDVAYKVGKILEDSYGERMKIAPILKKLSSNSVCLGKKTGQGFYFYNQKKSYANQSLLDSLNLAKKSMNSNQVLSRLLLPMINEATFCLEEKVIDKASFLDMALILGTGFPPFRGGLLRYADKVGIEKIRKKLGELAKKYPRFKASKFINENDVFYL